MPKRLSHMHNVSSAKPAPLFSTLGVIVLIIVMVAAFFISQLIGVYIAGRLLLPAASTLSAIDIILLGSNDGTILSVSLIITLGLLTLFTLGILKLKGGNSRDYLVLQTFNMTVGAGMFGLLLLFMIGSQSLTYVLDAAPSEFIDPLYETVSSVWLLILAIVIIAPLYEELIFRGLLWNAIAQRFSSETRGAIIASVITSVIFAVIHLQYGLYEISTIIVLALIFCYARVKSGSLLLPMLLHIINNGAAMWLYLSQVG